MSVRKQPASTRWVSVVQREAALGMGEGEGAVAWGVTCRGIGARGGWRRGKRGSSGGLGTSRSSDRIYIKWFKILKKSSCEIAIEMISSEKGMFLDL